MRKHLVAITIAALVVGCTNKTDHSGSAEDGSGIVKKVGAAISPSDWSLEKTTSGIDGEVYTASRIYEFPDRDAQFHAQLSCAAQTGNAEFIIDSFLGNPQTPREGSAYLSTMNAIGSMAPNGRVKASDGSISGLDTYFDVGADYNNRIQFDFNNPSSKATISAAPGYSQFSSFVEEGDINYARLLLAALPMIIEVKNGAGNFELKIDKSSEITDAMEGCGAHEPLLTARYLKRALDTEHKVKGQALDGIKRSCGFRGKVGEDSAQWVQDAKALSVSLDCTTAAPDQLAEFNSKIDAFLQSALEHGVPCSRDALLSRAEKWGIDDLSSRGSATNSFLYQRCQF